MVAPRGEVQIAAQARQETERLLQLRRGVGALAVAQLLQPADSW